MFVQDHTRKNKMPNKSEWIKMLEASRIKKETCFGWGGLTDSQSQIILQTMNFCDNMAHA